MKYFCNTCSVPICSDCALFGAEHKGHDFEHLKEVYKRHVDQITAENGSLQKRLKFLKADVSVVQETIEKVNKLKEERVKELENFVDQIYIQLNAKVQSIMNNL